MPYNCQWLSSFFYPGKSQTRPLRLPLFRTETGGRTKMRVPGKIRKTAWVPGKLWNQSDLSHRHTELECVLFATVAGSNVWTLPSVNSHKNKSEAEFPIALSQSNSWIAYVDYQTGVYTTTALLRKQFKLTISIYTWTCKYLSNIC